MPQGNYATVCPRVWVYETENRPRTNKKAVESTTTTTTTIIIIIIIITIISVASKQLTDEYGCPTEICCVVGSKSKYRMIK
jgi:heme/copper-type cytochrome/quinol oxidase subunit 2